MGRGMRCRPRRLYYGGTAVFLGTWTSEMAKRALLLILAFSLAGCGSRTGDTKPRATATSPPRPHRPAKPLFSTPRARIVRYSVTYDPVLLEGTVSVRAQIWNPGKSPTRSGLAFTLSVYDVAGRLVGSSIHTLRRLSPGKSVTVTDPWVVVPDVNSARRVTVTIGPPPQP